MAEILFRKMKPGDMRFIYKSIKRDFKAGEYAPGFVLRRQLEEGVQSGLIMSSEGRDVAYSICAEGRDNGYVLISLLAVFEQFRGRGFGTELLREICESSSGKNGVIVEVEKPELASDPEEETAAIRRIGFYEKQGFHLVHGIDYSIWDVPMHLMVLPGRASQREIGENIGRIMYDIYLRLMGKPFIHKMKLSFRVS